MPLLVTEWNPSRRQLRHFAWVVALVVAVIAWRSPEPGARFGLRLLAAFIFAVGTVWPGMWRWPYRVLAALTYPIGWVAGASLLAVVYFGLITPLALCFRIVRRDALQRRFEPQAASYWLPRFRVIDKRRYFRQF